MLMLVIRSVDLHVGAEIFEESTAREIMFQNLFSQVKIRLCLRLCCYYMYDACSTKDLSNDARAFIIRRLHMHWSTSRSCLFNRLPIQPSPSLLIKHSTDCSQGAGVVLRASVCLLELTPKTIINRRPIDFSKLAWFIQSVSLLLLLLLLHLFILLLLLLLLLLFSSYSPILRFFAS